MAEADEEGQVLLCSECFAEIGGGSCGDHPDDPPIDPTRPEVRDMLADKDAQALVGLQRKFMGIGAIPGVLVWVGLEAFRIAAAFLLPTLFVPRPMIWVVSGVVVLLGLAAGRQRANRRFKPRYTRWTGHDYQVGDDIEKMLWESRGP